MKYVVFIILIISIGASLFITINNKRTYCETNTVFVIKTNSITLTNRKSLTNTLISYLGNTNLFDTYITNSIDFLTFETNSIYISNTINIKDDKRLIVSAYYPFGLGLQYNIVGDFYISSIIQYDKSIKASIGISAKF